jgi:hypothetical protein
MDKLIQGRECDLSIYLLGTSDAEQKHESQYNDDYGA